MKLKALRIPILTPVTSESKHLHGYGYYSVLSVCCTYLVLVFTFNPMLK